MSSWFSKLQAVGKALMLPVAVLPAAALLLRLGAPDVLMSSTFLLLLKQVVLFSIT